MKRTTKSILSVLFALAMLLGMMPASVFASTSTTPAATAAATDATATVAPSAAATSWSAFLMYSAKENKWELYEDKGFNATPFVGDGVYTVTLKKSDLQTLGSAYAAGDPSTPQVFCVDIPGFAKAMEDAGKQLSQINNYADTTDAHDESQHHQKTDLTITAEVSVDGNKIQCDTEKINYGDIEEKGTFRMEFYNIWGLHAAAILNDCPVNPNDILPTDNISVTFTIQGTGFNTDAGAKQIADYQAAAVTPTTAAAPTTAPAADTTSDASSNGGSNTGLIIGIVAAVVVVVIIVIVAVSKKKK